MLEANDAFFRLIKFSHVKGLGGGRANHKIQSPTDIPSRGIEIPPWLGLNNLQASGT